MRLLVAASALTLVACSPTNPFDPASPSQLQAKATIVGHVFGTFTQQQLVLTLVDGHGTPVKDANGAARQVKTLGPNDPEPAGLPKVDGAKVFQAGDLVPDTYTVVFSASQNNEPLLLDAQSQPATLQPGDVVIRDLAVPKQDLNNVNGSVNGSVQGSSGGSFAVRLVSSDHNPDLAQTQLLSADGTFTFRHVAAAQYHIEASGDDYAPTSTAQFQVQSNTAFALPQPIQLTTLGRVFSLDDFNGHDGQPPFAPFLPASPAHVAVAPLVLPDPTLSVFARVFTDTGTPPGPEDGWQALAGADVIPADFDDQSDDGPRELIAQMRICFGNCVCATPGPDGTCSDLTFQPPLVSREIPLDFVFDHTPPRALTVTVDDVVRNTFDDLTQAPNVSLNCARFGSAECAVATLPTTEPSVIGDLVDDTSRVQGFAMTLDDTNAPTQFPPLGTLGSVAVIQGAAPSVDKNGPATRTLRIWAQDAAGNVGLVDIRTLTIDTTPIAFANPALVATAGTIAPVGNGAPLVPGTSVTVDVKANGEAPAQWQLVQQGSAHVTGSVIDAPIAYTGPQTINVDGKDGDTIALTVVAFDSAGNITRSTVPITLALTRVSTLSGVVTLENRADASGASVSIVNSSGTTVLTANAGGGTVSASVGNPNPVQGVMNLNGAYTFTNVPVATIGGVPLETYTVVANGPSPFLSSRAGVQLAPPGPQLVSPISLLLPRGSLVGRFVLEGRESSLDNSGIQVTLQNSLGKDVGSALSFADGTWRIDAVPVDSGYTAIGFFDGFIEAEVPGIEVLANVDNIVQPDANKDPTPVVLAKLSGDFRICATSASNALDANCTPVQFTNQSTVNIGGLSFDGIDQFRVSTTSFQESDTQPPFVDVTPLANGQFAAPQVTLGPSEGNVTVFLQLVPTGGTPGPVLTSSVTFDVTPPANVTMTIARGTGALVDGFTNEAVGRVTVNADPGAGQTAPLKNAFIVFANTAPSSPPAQTACPHGTPCAVPFQDNVEGTHTAFAFSCDAAGNCSTTPAQVSIAVDRTPPSLTNGTAFAPSAPFIASSAGALFTRGAAFDISVSTGHGNVTDASGNTVADVFATKFGLSPVVDDGTLRTIPAPAPLPNTQRIITPGVSLPPVDGTYTIFAQFTDAAGNVSTLNPDPFHVDITLDTSGPTVAFNLNAGATITNNPVVTLGVNDQSLDPTIIAQFNTTGIFVDTDPTTFDQRALPLGANSSFNLNAAAPPAGDGTYTVFARFFDRAGNESDRQASIVLDRTPPQALLVDCLSCTKSNGASFTNNAATHQIVLDTLALDNAGAVASVKTTVRQGASSGTPVTTPFASTTTVTLSVLVGGVPSSADGLYNVDVVFIDSAGNASAPVTVPVTLDTVAPIPTISINSGSLFTNNENVTLTLSGGASTAPIVGMRLNNTTNAFTGAQQTPTATLAWQLDTPAVDGNKVVFLEATDAAGNVGTASAQIGLDKTAPSGTVSIQGGAARINTTTANVTFSYTLSDVAAFAVTTTAAGFPANCAGVTFTNGNAFPAQVTFAPTAGGPEVRSVFVCTKDRAGNTFLATASTVLDQEFPTGSVTLNGGSQFTTSRNVTAAVNAPSDTAQIKTSFTGPGAAAALDCTNATGYAAIPSPPTIALAIPAASGAGLYTMQVCLKDAAGNISKDANGNPAPVTATIIFDAAAPTVSLQLNNGATFTTNSTVTLGITASDDLSAPLGGVVSMRIANTTPTFSGATLPIQQTTTDTVAAPTTEGTKTVCVEVTDAAGRTNNTCASITLQLTGPAGTVNIAKVNGTFNTSSNGQLSTTFSSSDAKIVSFAFGQAPLDCSSLPAASFQAMAVNVPQTLNVAVAGGEGTRAVTGCFKSGSGLITSATDTVFVDPTDPPLAQPLAPANASFVSTKTPVFQWAAVNEAVTYTLLVNQVSNGANVLTQAGISTLSFTPAVAQALPQVPLTWIVVAVKASGRSSPQVFSGAPTFTVDATAPTAATGLTVAANTGKNLITSPAPCTAANPCINDANPLLSFTVGTDAQTTVSSVVDIALNSDFTSPVASISRANGAAFGVPIALVDGNYGWRVRTTDQAGNTATSATATFVVDRTAPTTPTITPPKDPISQTLAASIPLVWSNETATGAVNYRFEITTDVLGFGSPLFAATQAATTKDVKGLLSNGAQVRHIFRVASIDALGNQSAFATATFINDTVAPCTVSSSLTVLGGNGVANGFSNSSVVTVQLSCIGDNPSQMQVGCDGVAAGKPFTAFTNVVQCVLPAGQGSHTVQALISDTAGNTSAAISNTINVDTIVPTTPILSTQNSFTNANAFTVALASPSTDTNFDHSEFLGGTVSTFTPFAGLSFNVPLAAADGANIVRVRGVDLAGNISPEAAVTITKDTVAPQTPIILGGAGPVFVNASTFTFSLDPTSQTSADPNFDTYQTASCTGTGCSVGAFTNNSGSGTFTFNLSKNASTTFAVRGHDKAGNVSAAAFVTVVEDSLNPRPVALEPLPATSIAGPSFAQSGLTVGPYVDVFLARSELNIAPAQIDPNFDHFEMRGTTNAFLGFVPMCTTPTPLCPIPFTSDTGVVINQPSLIIQANGNIVGFRMPVVSAKPNTFTLRSVDKAGNVSLETTTTTQESTVQFITNNQATEIAPALFGDKVAYIDQATSALHVHEAGNDQLWGTTDDSDVVIDTNVSAEGTGVSTQTANAIAFGPNEIFYDKNNQVLMVTAGADGLYGTAGDNTAPVNISSDGGGAVVDETKGQSQPSFWRDRMTWKQSTSGTETDVIVRQAAIGQPFGAGTDTFAKFGTAGTHRLFPVISGDNLAFLFCNNTSAFACPNTTAFQLVVVNAGPDHLFGTGDDVTTSFPTANTPNIDAIHPVLFTPGTPGRPACRNVVAYAGFNANEGIQVIAAEPDGTFSVNDTPVNITQGDRNNTHMRGFALYDNIAVSEDGFVPPFSEVTTGGKDGCLTRTADNLHFDAGDNGDSAGQVALNGNVLILTQFSPTPDLKWVELGSEREVWPRPEGTSTFLNMDVDRQGISFGGGGELDFASRTLRVAYNGGDEGVFFDRFWVHGTSAGNSPAPLTLIDRAVDDVFGTGDDVLHQLAVPGLPGSRPLHPNNNSFLFFGQAMDVDENAAAWSGFQVSGGQTIPVVHSAGPDEIFGTNDDCEIEIAGVTGQPNYNQIHLSKGRMAFQQCTDVNCSASTGPVFVREVTGNGDPCSGASPVVTQLSASAGSPVVDGERYLFTFNGIHVVEAGADHKLTTTGDNVQRDFFQPTDVSISQNPGMSGDRVVWIDQRSSVNRVVMADVADLSFRVLNRSPTATSNVSVEGDVVGFGTDVPGGSFIENANVYYVGVEPDLPQDFVNPGPTRLRCPTDDIYENNDSRLTATPLNSGAALNGIVCKGNVDRFAISALNNCTIHAHSHFLNAEGNLDMVLLDPNDAQVASSTTANNDELINFATGATSGTFNVEMLGSGGVGNTVENTYDLTVNVTCP